MPDEKTALQWGRLVLSAIADIERSTSPTPQQCELKVRTKDGGHWVCRVRRGIDE